MSTEKAPELLDDQQWEDMAKLVGLPTAEFRTKYEAFIADAPGPLQPMPTKIGDARKDGDCISRTFEISFFKALGLKVEVKFCPQAGGGWEATLTANLLVLGSSVWETTYTLTSSRASVCFEPELLVAKGKLCFEISERGSELCFRVYGNACYWRPFEWECADFDETPFCF